MSLENREDLDDLRLDSVDDPIAAFDDFADACPGKLGHRPAHLREFRQSVAALDKTMNETLGRIGIGMSNEILNLE